MGILKRCGWLYLDEGSHMLLIKETSTKETVTIKAKLTKQNIYCLVVYGVKEVIMSLHGQGRPTHLMGTTPTQHLWHRRFGHASHARIKLASTMVNGLLLDQANESYEATNESASDSEHLSPNNSEHLSLNDSERLTPDVESRSAKGKSKSNRTIEPLTALQANGDLMKVCQPCVQSKQTRIIQHTSMRTTKRILERLHSDLWGPHDPESLGGSLYAGVLVDNYSKKSWVGFLKMKNEFYDWFTCMVPKLERLTDEELAHLRVDGGGEYISHELLRWCKTKGISIEHSAPYTLEHNSVSEQTWRTLRMMKDSLLLDADLPNVFWAEAMLTVNELKNLLPASKRDKVPNHTFTGVQPSVAHLHIFGSVAHVHIPKEKRIKSDIKCT